MYVFVDKYKISWTEICSVIQMGIKQVKCYWQQEQYAKETSGSGNTHGHLSVYVCNKPSDSSGQSASWFM